MAVKKVILSCAVTGGIHTPAMSPYFPYSPEMITESALGAAEAGASMVHIHARTEVGVPTSDVETMRKIISGIKARNNNIVIGITTGGLGIDIRKRMEGLSILKPEIASLNSGSMNFSFAGLAKSVEGKEIYDWETPFLKGSYEKVFDNSFTDIEIALTMMKEAGTKPEIEIFDLGQLYNIAHFYKKGLIPDPVFLQFVLGVQGGAALTIENLVHMINEAKRLFGPDVQYSIVAGGRKAFRLEAFNAINGGHCRVGMEDSLYISPDGTQAESNAQQVAKMKCILEALDFEVATPDEAREMLNLKGSDKVNY